MIDGRYRVDRVLGIGGMGVVLAVTHVQLAERYAIKFVLPEHARDADTFSRFIREARAAARIKSDHVARVQDVAQLDDGTPFLVMEFLEGMDLGKLLRRSGPLR